MSIATWCLITQTSITIITDWFSNQTNSQFSSHLRAIKNSPPTQPSVAILQLLQWFQLCNNISKISNISIRVPIWRLEGNPSKNAHPLSIKSPSKIALEWQQITGQEGFLYFQTKISAFKTRKIAYPAVLSRINTLWFNQILHKLIRIKHTLAMWW